MKAITLHQPWASLWCSGRKVHETRHWPTKNRGWIAVHAAMKIVYNVDPELAEILCDEFGGHWGMDLPRGALIGRVHLVDCWPTKMLFRLAAANEDDRICGDFSEGRWAWKADQFKTFKRPIPMKGRQGFFSVPDNLQEILDSAP
jgi:activating signal cointegrator 1